MKVNFSNPGTFFPWPGEPEGSDVGVTLRLPNQKAIFSFDEKTVTEGDFRVIDGQLLRERVVDEKLREELRLDYCIVDWKGLVDEQGKVIPCTSKNKVRAMHSDLDFMNFVNSSLVKLRIKQEEWIKGI